MCFRPVQVKSDEERFPTDTLYCKTTESEAGSGSAEARAFKDEKSRLWQLTGSQQSMGGIVNQPSGEEHYRRPEYEAALVVFFVFAP